MDRRSFVLGSSALVGTFTVFGAEAIQAAPQSVIDKDNVRELLEHLKKSIHEATQEYLFEYNDETLRKGFRDWVKYCADQYVEDGTIQDYKVVCDETNNTPERIDNNEFVADVYIKPTKAVSYIQ